MPQLITKHNMLIKSSYRLTLSEMRLILYGVSLINPLKPDFPTEYSINIERFAQMFNIDKNRLYREIKEIAHKKLFRREFSYELENGETRVTHWLHAIDYEDKNGYVKLYFSPTIKPLLHQIKENFTSYYIEQIAHFKSIYAIRMYEQAIMLLNQSKRNKTCFSFKIDELKNLLETKDKYNRFANFKERILERAKKEINKHSNIKFSYEVIKQGRTPTEIKFTVSHREKRKEQQLPLLDTNSVHLSPSIIEKGKQIASQSGNGWDIYAIVEQFKTFAQQKGLPDNVNGAFLGFVKKKVSNTP